MPPPYQHQNTLILSNRLSHWNCEIAFSNLGEVVLIGAQISAPLLRATPAVQETGTRHKPLLLRLYGPNSWRQNNQFLHTQVMTFDRCGKKKRHVVEFRHIKLDHLYILNEWQHSIHCSDKLYTTYSKSNPILSFAVDVSIPNYGIVV